MASFSHENGAQHSQGTDVEDISTELQFTETADRLRDASAVLPVSGVEDKTI